MIPHVTQPLNNDFLTFQVSVQFGEGNAVRISEKLLKSVLNPPAGCFDASGNAAEMNGFSRYASAGVDVGRVELLILIGNP